MNAERRRQKAEGRNEKRIVTRVSVLTSAFCFLPSAFIRRANRQQLAIPRPQLDDHGIFQTRMWHSLDSLTILFAIEEQFHISIPDDRARAITTFGDLIDIVQELAPPAAAD